MSARNRLAPPPREDGPGGSLASAASSHWRSLSARDDRRLLFGILALGLALRLWDLGRPFLGDLAWNEVFYTTIARNFDRYGFAAQYNYGSTSPFHFQQVLTHSPLVVYLVYLFIHILGPAEWVARLPILACGMLSLVLVYLIAAELFDRQSALAATFFAAVMPGIVFFSHTVQLDGPMVCFGLAALATLLHYARGGRLRWAILSGAFLALAIFTKYTAVLFLPSLVWIWWKRLKEKGGISARGCALVALSCLLPLLPALAWLVFTVLAPRTAEDYGPAQYLLRSERQQPRDWIVSLLATWTALETYSGRIVWYGFLAIGISALFHRGRGLLAENGLILLMIGPWFLQMVYPVIWTNNLYLIYPALYGLALLAGVSARAAGQIVARGLATLGSVAGAWPGVFLGLIVVSSVWQYRETFHGSYYPWNVVSRDDPLVSAKLVSKIRSEDDPVLADIVHTLYYAGGGRESVAYKPDEEAKLAAAIESRRFKYVVFTYSPTIGALEAIGRSEYERVGPAAWSRDGGR